MTVATCSGITKGGQKCRARPLPGTSWCVFHSADAARRREWSAAGGKNSSAQARARKQLVPGEVLESDELAAWLGVCFKRVIAGKMDPPVGTAAANLARAIVEIGKAALVEERIEAIERELGIEKRRAS